jgi:Fe-S-cluster containining protein
VSFLLQLINTNFCKECKDCCRFHPENAHYAPAFTPKDKKYIIERLGFSKDLFYKNYNNEWTVKFEQKEGKYILCPFLKNERCAVQKIKPFNCLLYPFILMESKDRKKIVVAFDDGCKAVKKQKLAVAFKEKLKFLEKLFNSEKELKKIAKLRSHVEPYQGHYKIIFELPCNSLKILKKK